MTIRLATCTYQEFRPAMGLPVRSTVGHPRFNLGYSLAGNAALIAPPRTALQLPRDAFTLVYRRHLEQVGVNRIGEQLEAIAASDPAAASGGKPLVLLCFDRLDKPNNWCHRSMFAAWYQEHTGQVVPELGAPAPQPGSMLFDL